LEERRAARRYKLALQLEIRLESELREFEPIFGWTRNILTHGFYFRIGQGLSVGMKSDFLFCRHGQKVPCIYKRADLVTRVEEVSESSDDRLGVGAVIGRVEWP